MLHLVDLLHHAITGKLKKKKKVLKIIRKKVTSNSKGNIGCRNWLMIIISIRTYRRGILERKRKLATNLKNHFVSLNRKREE